MKVVLGLVLIFSCAACRMEQKHTRNGTEILVYPFQIAKHQHREVLEQHTEKDRQELQELLDGLTNE